MASLPDERSLAGNAVMTEAELRVFRYFERTPGELSEAMTWREAVAYRHGGILERQLILDEVRKRIERNGAELPVCAQRLLPQAQHPDT